MNQVADIEGVRSWTFYAPLIVRSQNVTSRGRSSSARFTRHAKARDTARSVFFAQKQIHRIPDATGPRSVTFTRILGWRERLFDPANLVGGMKGVVDAMVLERLLVDDSADHLVATYHQDPSDRLRGPQVLVRIEEIDS